MAYWLRRSQSEPFFWLGQYPVYATELLIFLHSVAFVVLGIGEHAGFSGVIVESLKFQSSHILGHWRLWELGTYIFVPAVDLMFLFNMAMLFWYGRELEAHLGRKGFLLLYFCLTVCPMLILSALHPILPSEFAGSGTVHFCIFLAFASLFPEAEVFFGFQAKWVGLVLLSVYSLLIFSHDRGEWQQHLLVLWISSAIATFAIRTPLFSSFVEWLETGRERREEAVAQKARQRAEQQRQIHEQTIDEILDKISQHGMHSLTPDERATLERARANLLKKEKR